MLALVWRDLHPHFVAQGQIGKASAHHRVLVKTNLELEVIVQLDDGRVFRFLNMDCRAELLGDTLSVTAPDYLPVSGRC